MLSPVTFSSGSIQGFYPLLSALPNQLATAWKGFASHRFSLFNWKTATFLSLAIAIAVLFENKRLAARCQDLARKNDGLGQKKTDHKRQLDTAHASTKVWRDLYINTTSLNAREKQKLIKEVQDIVKVTVDALGTLTKFLNEQMRQIPETNNKEFAQMLKEIEDFRRFIETSQSTEDDGYVDVNFTNPRFLEKLSTFSAEIERKYTSAVSSISAMERQSLEKIVTFVQEVVNAIKKQNANLLRLQTDKK